MVKRLAWVSAVIGLAFCMALVSTRLGSEALKTVSGLILLPGAALVSIVWRGAAGGGLVFIGTTLLANLFVYCAVWFVISKFIKRGARSTWTRRR
jgi:hypothetical protein